MINPKRARVDVPLIIGLAMKNENHATADLRKLGELIDGIDTAMLTTHA